MQNPSYKKILFSDIDETLVTTDKRLTDENRAAIAHFLDTGNDRVFAYERKLENRILTVICSFSGKNETIREDLAAKIREGKVLIGNYADGDKVHEVPQESWIDHQERIFGI